MIETGEIKVPAKKILSLLILHDGKFWQYLSILGILVFVILGITVDVRFFVIALMWVFLIIPMEIAFLYFYYGMRPLTVFNATAHKIIFQNNDIVIQLIQKEDSPEYEETENRKEYRLQKDSFTSFKAGGDYVIMNFGTKGWLYLPLSSFNSMDEFKEIIGNFTKA